MKKKRHLKTGIKVILFVLLVVVLIGLLFILNIFNFKDDKGIIKSFKTTTTTTENPIKTYEVSLVATGDALLHNPVIRAGNNGGTYDYSNILTYTKDVISKYDIRYYNQETVSDSTKGYKGYPVFNTPVEFNQNMIDAGFNLISLASNHSMDMGIKSALASAEWWESKTDVLATGMASSLEKRSDYRIMEKNGITYTMLNYTYGTNGIPIPNGYEYAINLFDKEQALKDIEAVRDKVDVLMVAMHWGNEYNQDITTIQKEQAKWLGENGVDIILGAHSHCIEPWEWIDEDTVVFYSLGNFVSNQMGANTPIIKKVGVVGVFASLNITKTVDSRDNTKTIKIDNISADLNYSYRYTNSKTGKYDYLVIPFSQMESKYLSNYESVYNEFSAVLKKYDDSINIAPLPTAN